LQDALKKSIHEIACVDFSIARKMSGVGAIRRHICGVVAMKKGGKKYILYVVSNSYVIWILYLEGVAQRTLAPSMCTNGRISSMVSTYNT